MTRRFIAQPAQREQDFFLPDRIYTIGDQIKHYLPAPSNLYLTSKILHFYLQLQ